MKTQIHLLLLAASVVAVAVAPLHAQVVADGALPLTNWTHILTDQFNASGNFIFTNSISPAVSRRFYLLQVP